MDINVTTPALLFPAISLLLLAYTNRFLGLSSLVRHLHSQYKTTGDSVMRAQIATIRHRLILIKNMQAIGVLSLFLCVLCMFLLFAGCPQLGKIVFAISLLCLLVSLGISIREIQMSVNALNLQLGDMEDSDREGGKRRDSH